MFRSCSNTLKEVIQLNNVVTLKPEFSIVDMSDLTCFGSEGTSKIRKNGITFRSTIKIELVETIGGAVQEVGDEG